MTAARAQRELNPALRSRAPLCEATGAKRHLVYSHLLSLLELSETDAKRIERAHNLTPDTARSMLIRSVPSEVGRILIPHSTAKTFDYNLWGVPGFYYAPLDSPAHALARICAIDYGDVLPCGLWKLNIPDKCLLKPYYTNRHRIAGLMVFTHAEAFPLLFSSRGLLLGTPAAKPKMRDLTLY